MILPSLLIVRLVKAIRNDRKQRLAALIEMSHPIFDNVQLAKEVGPGKDIVIQMRVVTIRICPRLLGGIIV
jgi:hypothetical protein